MVRADKIAVKPQCHNDLAFNSQFKGSAKALPMYLNPVVFGCVM